MPVFRAIIEKPVWEMWEVDIVANDEDHAESELLEYPPSRHVATEIERIESDTINVLELREILDE